MLYSFKKFGFIRPVHVHLKTDKLDYLQSPSQQFFFSIFQLQNSIQQPWEVELSLAWFIFSLGQCVLGQLLSRIKRKLKVMNQTRQEKGNYILSLFDTIDIVRLHLDQKVRKSRVHFCKRNLYKKCRGNQMQHL